MLYASTLARDSFCSPYHWGAKDCQTHLSRERRSYYAIEKSQYLTDSRKRFSTALCSFVSSTVIVEIIAYEKRSCPGVIPPGFTVVEAYRKYASGV